MKNKDGQPTTDKKLILGILKDFYSNLYSESLEEKDLRTIPHILNQGSEELPAITTWEVKKSLEEMKNGKAPGEDGIVIEAAKEGREILLKAITLLFNKCLIEATTPTEWNHARIVIMHKKGISQLAYCHASTNYSPNLSLGALNLHLTPISL